MCSIYAQNVSKGAITVKLDNGLTVLIKEDHSQPVVSVQVWVKVGSINENSGQKGLSHFLEHLLFKGTEKYPGDEISRRVENEGGSINAATSKEYTQYHIDIQKDGAEEAIRILADAVANAAMPEADIDKERPVVIEEIVRHYDNPGGVLYDKFSEALFIKTPYRFSIIGSSSVIKNVSRSEIMDYYHSWYAPRNMFLSIVGDISSKKALDIVKDSFGRQKNSDIPKTPDLTEDAHGPNGIVQEKDVEHDYLLAGFLGPDIMSNDQFVADVTANILGGGRSSRLFRKLREEKQLVYVIGSSFESQRGCGVLVFSSVFAAGKENQALEAINNEVASLMKNGPTDAELLRAKEMIKSEWYFDLESFHDQAAILAYWNLQGNPTQPDAYIGNINKVTKENVKDFLVKYYKDQLLTYALLAQEKK